MLGHIDLHMSWIRWTVSGFPNPQQFQLTIAKEDPELGGENPPAGGCGSLHACFDDLSYPSIECFAEVESLVYLVRHPLDPLVLFFSIGYDAGSAIGCHLG